MGRKGETKGDFSKRGRSEAGFTRTKVDYRPEQTGRWRSQRVCDTEDLLNGYCGYGNGVDASELLDV